MPTFQIEQYELHVIKYKVKAKDEAQAIAKVLGGLAEPEEGSLEYVEVAEDFGLPADEDQQLVRQLRKLGVQVDEVVPSIRSVEQVG
jgi:type III secretion system FlhB-like substrate exporter